MISFKETIPPAFLAFWASQLFSHPCVMIGCELYWAALQMWASGGLTLERWFGLGPSALRLGDLWSCGMMSVRSKTWPWFLECRCWTLLE